MPPLNSRTDCVSYIPYLADARPPLPTPWTVEDIGAAFKVCDSTGQALAYVYFEDESGRRSAAKLLEERDEGTANCCEHCKTAGAIEPPSDVASALNRVAY